MNLTQTYAGRSRYQVFRRVVSLGHVASSEPQSEMANRPSPLSLQTRLNQIVREWAAPIAELAVRLAVIALGADLLLRAPIPLEGTPLTLLHALIVFGAVALIGISILETLFYNHYRP
jgi:type IV secretory pathway VirB2 component (pilin)